MIDENDLPLENYLLSEEEEFKIKTVCEFLFFDQLKDYATYNRFEQCFQPLINDLNLSTDKIFKELAGKQKKYITYKRFINCYLANKNKTRILPKDVRTFFNTLMNNLIHDENSPIGHPKTRPFYDHQICFYNINNQIFIRVYQILNEIKEKFTNQDQESKTQLLEIGPRFSLKLIRIFAD